MVFFFFFKQKPEYEMRISDWSSDVCSSDLASLQLSGLQQAIEQQIERGRANIAFLGEIGEPARLRNFPVIGHRLIHHVAEMLRRVVRHIPVDLVGAQAATLNHRRECASRAEETGRASCRARVCQYV